MQSERIAAFGDLSGRHQFDFLAEPRQPAVGDPRQTPRHQPGKTQ
jgi:hypothetical protein